MELRRYLSIIQRAWWLVVGVPLLVLAVSLISFRPDPSRYRVTAKIAVTLDVIGGNEILPDMNVYNSWQSSQFIVDDLPAIIRSQAFASAVSQWIGQNQGMTLDSATIQGTFDVERDHRIISLTINADSAEQAVAIAAGSVAVLQEQGLRFWNRAPADGLAVSVLDLPQTASALSRWPQPITRLALRLMLAVVAGVGLTFLRHYLDRIVRERTDLEAVGVPMLAAIPKEV